MTDFSALLNPEQCRAATAGQGPILVLAAAGTGKTRTLVHRVAYLVENGVPAERVIWPTESQDPELASKYKAAMDMLANKELDLVINIPKNFSTGELTNGYHVRRAAIDYNIPLITNARLATAFIRAFCSMSIDDIQIKSWDQY